jgi:hypothetical protein
MYYREYGAIWDTRIDKLFPWLMIRDVIYYERLSMDDLPLNYTVPFSLPVCLYTTEYCMLGAVFK